MTDRDHGVLDDDGFLRAADVARECSDQLGRTIAPNVIGKAARKGKLPIAARRRDGAMLFTDAAVRAFVSRERERRGELKKLI